MEVARCCDDAARVPRALPAFPPVPACAPRSAATLAVFGTGSEEGVARASSRRTPDAIEVTFCGCAVATAGAEAAFGVDGAG